MTYIVTDNCIRCKYTDCVEVCPVDCFYEGENFLVIHPDECIDCGVCEPECPAEAIKPDTEPGPRHLVEAERWLDAQFLSEGALVELGDQRTLALITDLPPDQRDVMVLRIVADLTVEQVAAVLEDFLCGGAS